MNQAFIDTHAVITGASSGIGREIAMALARAGVRSIVVHCRENRDGAERTAQEVAEFGCQGYPIAADIADAADRQRLVDQSFERLGTVQTWVNVAGADVLTGSSSKLEFESKLQQLIDVDVTGTILLSRLAADRIIEQRLSPPPSMVFVGWDQATEGMEGDAGQMFGPTKAAVAAFAASLAQTVAPKLRVNTVAPGWIQTAWGEQTSDYWNQRAQRQSLMGRWGTPHDVAKAVLYLTDPDNTFVTGQRVDVNGGWNRTD